MQSVKQGPHFTPYMKINSQGIKELNLRLKTCKVLRQETILDTGIAKGFLDKTLEIQ